MSSPPTLSRHLPTLRQRATTLPHHLQLHGLILKTALDHHHRFVPRLLSPMCTHSIQHARSIFDALPLPPSIHAWNTMIRAYAKSPRNLESIRLFSKLRQAGFNPNNYTYPFVLKACGSSLMVDVGRTVHGLVLKVGFVMDTFVGNTLLHMYACAGVITSAKTVFDEMPMRDVVSWSSMVEGYVSW